MPIDILPTWSVRYPEQFIFIIHSQTTFAYPLTYTLFFYRKMTSSSLREAFFIAKSDTQLNGEQGEEKKEYYEYEKNELDT